MSRQPSNWDAIHMPAEKTCAILPGETTPFPHIPTLTGKSAAGTYFSVIYPNCVLRDHAGLHVVAACRAEGPGTLSW